MYTWQFWGLISMMLVLNTNIVDDPFTRTVSFLFALGIGLYAGHKYSTNRYDR